MSIQTLTQQIVELVLNLVPQAHIEVIPGKVDPLDVFVNVYSVPREQVDAVENAIIDLGVSICGQTGFVLTPFVRDEETTQKYYPSRSTPPESQIVFLSLDGFDRCAAWDSMVSIASVPLIRSNLPANEDLALAA